MKVLNNCITKIITIILAILIVINITGMIFNNELVTLLNKEPTNGTYAFTYILIFVGAIAITFGIVALFKLINKLSNKKLNILAIVLLCVYGGLTFLNIFIFPTTQNADAFQTLEQSIAMTRGYTDIIDGNSPYFSIYSNNNAIVIIYYWLFSIFQFLSNDGLVVVGRIFNALCIVGSQVLFYFGVLEFTGKKTTAVKFLLISAFYPSVQLISSWLYTPTLCLPFMGGIFLCGAKLINCTKGTISKKSIILYSSLFAILTVVGYKVRAVVAIMAIAWAVCVFLWSIQNIKQFLKIALAILITVIVGIGSFIGVSAIDNHYYTGSDKNFPLSHWVAMSLVGEGDYYYPIVSRHKQMNTKEEIDIDSKNIIETTLENTSIGELWQHQYNKTVAMWCDGTLGFGARQSRTQVYHSIQQYTCGSKQYTLDMYCQMLWLSFHLLILVLLFNLFRNKGKKNLILALTLLGAYLFYAIWEIKSNYAVPFAQIILALATIGGVELENSLCYKEILPKTSRIVMASTSAIFIATLLFGTTLVIGDTVKRNECMLYNSDNKGTYISDVSKHDNSLEQEFYMGDDFNKVIIFASKTNRPSKAIYKITLRNSNNEIIAKKYLTQKALDKNTDMNGIVLRLKEAYHPNGNEKFTINIKSSYPATEVIKYPENDTVRFPLSDSSLVNCVKGDMYIGGELAENDLKFTILNTEETTLMNGFSYFTLVAFIAIIEVLTYLCLFKNKKKVILSKHQL